jgi:hypothetical protein
MLNLTRSLGTSLGVAAGAATLSWRLRAEDGSQGWLTASSETLLAAVGSSLPVLVLLAILALTAALVSTRSKADTAGAS